MLLCVGVGGSFVMWVTRAMVALHVEIVCRQSAVEPATSFSVAMITLMQDDRRKFWKFIGSDSIENTKTVSTTDL